MTPEELLSQLQGLKTPEHAPWFPLAPGWWLIVIGVAALLSGWWFYKCKKNNARFYQVSHRELLSINLKFSDTSQNAEFIQAISRWLRQVSLQAFPDKDISALTGDNWLNFLDSILYGNDFSQGDGKVFGTLVYSKQPEINRTAILSLCNRWLIQIDIKQDKARQKRPVIQLTGKATHD